MEKRSILVLLLMALVAIHIAAAPVDEGAARLVASRMMQSSTTARMMRGSSSPVLQHTQASLAAPGHADYYVFNTSDGSAFVIVAGDDRAEAVLGYGEGSLDMAVLPCNLRWLLDSYTEQMEYLHAHPDVQVELSAPADNENIIPMITSDWGQQVPFYNQCPMYQGERSVTGCVATAMAQVMNYWRYPARLPALGGYNTRSHHIYVSPLPGTDVNWDNMLNNYGATPYSDAQANAVATLMRYCGQAVRMDYSPEGSGAYVDQQLSAMKTFGYNPAATVVGKGTTPYDEWREILLAELRAGRPLLYSANDPAAGGHAFVVDGYYDGKFHINWGWNGNNNGYFALGAFNVRNYSFLSSQQILADLYPRDSEHEVRDLHDFVADGIYYRYGDVDGEVAVAPRDSRYGSYSGHVTIPATVTHDGRELAVTAIGDLAFYSCYTLTGVDLPEGVTRIGQQAFGVCLELDSIALPSTLRQVDARAFVECTSLTAVYTPSQEAWLSIRFADRNANPVSLSHRLLVAGQELEHLTVPQAVTSLSPYALVDCTTLRSVAMHDGVTTVGTSALEGCTALTTVTMPAAMSSLGARAFYGCTALTGLAVPSGIERLENDLFNGCASLTGVSLPDGLTSIGNAVFNGCSSLTAIAIPEGVTTIGANALKGCSRLAAASLPTTLTAIGEGAFHSCSSLAAVTIPDGVRAVEGQTFYRCSRLRELTLGKQLETIALKAFDGCAGLAAITCRGSVPPAVANPDCFVRSIYSTARLMVPASALALYKRTGIWPWFTNMVGINVDFPYGDVNEDGEVNIADVNAIIDAILTGERGTAHDVNGDGEVNIADVNAVIDMIMLA